MSVSNIVLKTHVLQHMDSSNLPTKVTEMKDNRDLKFVNIEAKGFQDLCNRIAELEAENEQLILVNKQRAELLRTEMDKNKELKAQLSNEVRRKMGLKYTNRRLRKEIDELENRLDNVTLWDLSPEAQEEAGHALARSLLGGK